MLFVLGGLAIAVVAAHLRGGRLEHAAHAGLRAIPLAVFALVLQLLAALAAAPDRPASDVGLASLVLSSSALLAFCVTNWFRAGIPLIGVGVALNTAVMVANRGMPVAPDAVTRLGGDLGALPIVGAHHVMTSATRLPWLGDVVPLAPLPLVVSVGDIATVIGIGMLVQQVMAVPRRRSAVEHSRRAQLVDEVLRRRRQDDRQRA